MLKISGTYLVELLPVLELTVEPGRGERAEKIHAAGDALPEWIRLRQPDWEALLRVEGPWVLAAFVAAVQVLVGGRVR